MVIKIRYQKRLRRLDKLLTPSKTDASLDAGNEHVDHLDNKAKSLLPMIESMPQVPEGVDKGFRAVTSENYN